MAYCTQGDLEAVLDGQKLIDLTDDSGAGAIDDAKLSRAMDDASAVIDGHLRARYSVPLAAPAPPYVRKLAVDLAVHALYSRREGDLGLPDGVRDRYKSAMEALKAIRDGKQDLGVDPPPAASTAVAADTDGPDRLFTPATLKDF